MGKITIVGAGLSGMIAGTLLARKGHEVVILEAGKTLGGLRLFHPSTHVTPVDESFLWNYIGMDLTPCFPPVREGRYYIRGRGYRMNTMPLRVVERGPRKTSLDTHLYNEALRAGVKFEFGHLVKDFKDLPPKTIVATGLNPEGFEGMDVPHLIVQGYYLVRETDDPSWDKIALAWFNDYSVDYGYAAAVNGIQYFLLFSSTGMSGENLKEFQRDLEETEGVRLDGFRLLEGCIPMARLFNPRLFAGDTILAGTLSGMMDPALFYGIHGAVVSGKIAAQAVDDPEGALREFRKFSRWFAFTLFQRRLGLTVFLPLRFVFMKMMVTVPWLFLPSFWMGGKGVPGYPGNWIVESMKGVRPLPRRTHA